MLKKLAVAAILAFNLVPAHSQVVISEGAQLICTGNFTNTSGAITNNGKLEVQGNFVNTGTYSSADNLDSLLLTGSTATTANGGAATYNYVLVNKTAGGVTLAGNLLVNGKFDLTAGAFSTNPATAFELVAPRTAVFNFGSGTQVVGKVRRTNWTNGATVAFHSPIMTVATTGGTAPTSMLVNVVPAGDPTGSEKEVKRYYHFTTQGGTGYTATVSMPYQASELNGNVEARLVPWYANSGEWTAKLTGNTVNTTAGTITSTGVSAAALTSNEWKLADPRYTLNLTAFLRGNWNGSTQQMTTTLNTAGVLPAAQPYNTTPYNYTGTETVGSIPNVNVTDWVLVEVRKPASGLPADATSATIIGRKAGFLLANGSIVDLDGTTPISFDLSKQGNCFVVVRHRNHLAVMSNAISSNETGTFTNDFSALANVYQAPGAPSAPLTALASSTKYGMWAGDANKNGSVNAIDLGLVKAGITNGSTGYLFTDTNLSNSLNALDLGISKLSITNSATGGAPVAFSNNDVKTHVPH